MTKDELVKSILKECDVASDEKLIKSMNETFRVGFLRGVGYTS